MTTPAPNMGSTPPSWAVPPGIAFSAGPGNPGTPGTPGPPGIVHSPQVPGNLTRGPIAPDSSSMFQRPSMPLSTGPLAPNSAIQPQLGAPYQSFPTMAAPHQGLWLQPPPQMGGVPRLPIVPYAAAPFAGPHIPLMARGMPPAVPVPDSQPPGVIPAVNAAAIPAPSSAASFHQVAGSSATRTESHSSGIDIVSLLIIQNYDIFLLLYLQLRR